MSLVPRMLHTACYLLKFTSFQDTVASEAESLAAFGRPTKATQFVLPNYRQNVFTLFNSAAFVVVNSRQSAGWVFTCTYLVIFLLFTYSVKMFYLKAKRLKSGVPAILPRPPKMRGPCPLWFRRLWKAAAAFRRRKRHDQCQMLHKIISCQAWWKIIMIF